MTCGAVVPQSLARLEGAAGDLRLALDRRSRLQAALQKYKELKIVDRKECHDETEEASTSKGGCQPDRASREQTATHSNSKTEWAFSKPSSALDEESEDPTSLAAQLKARQGKTVAAQPRWVSCTAYHQMRFIRDVSCLQMQW